MQLENKYNELEKEVNMTYKKLYDLVSEDIIINNYEYNQTINIIDEIMGGCYQVFIKEFNKNGYFLTEDVDNKTEEYYTLNNIYSLLDKITVVEQLQNLLINRLENIIK